MFVSKGKLYDVQDQDFNDLENTDHTVRLTGGLDSDGRSITVTQIETATGTTK